MSAPAARPLLLLWGFMGSGKSTVGRATAARASVRFVDLDEEVEKEAGMSIAAIFAEHGEERFRALEQQALERQLDGTGRAVVALGGGALVDDALRTRALREAFVVTLTAPLETLLSRVDGSDRPLLGDAEHLWKQRTSAYAEAHATLEISGQTVDQLAEALLNTWKGWQP